MTVLRVLGIGSPFGDDNAGWEAVKIVQKKPSLSQFTREELEIAYYDRPGMGLLNLLSNTQTAILIDAIKTTGEPGRIHRIAPEAIETWSTACSTHDLGVAQALQMGAILNLLPERVILYGITVHHVYSSIRISQGIETMASEIEGEIIRILKGRN